MHLLGQAHLIAAYLAPYLSTFYEMLPEFRGLPSSGLSDHTHYDSRNLGFRSYSQTDLPIDASTAGRCECRTKILDTRPRWPATRC
jgi:hypothetical protein